MEQGRIEGEHSRVAGVVLAAGASTRFGRNKLLLNFDGESLARRAARTALSAALDPVVCVLGHEAERIRKELAGLPVRVVINEAPEKGLNSSITAGIAALPESAAAAIVQLADMPFVSAAMLRRLVDAFRRTGAPLVASNYGGIHAPPALYARDLFPELAEAEGEGAGRRVARRHEKELVRVEWPAAALVDVDREEDWKRMCAAG